MRSMPDTENPRSHIQPLPLPIPSNQDLQITARNAKFHTCEDPTRKEVARENYERRRHQMSKCGYRSVIYKPYQPVGEVFLDDTKLNLSALRYEQIKPNKTTTHIWARKPTLWGGTYIYGLYKGVPHPPRVISCCLLLVHFISLLYFLRSLLYLDVVSSFLLTSSCLLVTSKHQIFTADYVSFCINNQQWKADALLAVVLCKLTVTNFQFLITLPDPL